MSEIQGLAGQILGKYQADRHSWKKEDNGNRTHQNPVEKTFPASENNYSQAVGAARGIVRMLHNKKDGSLEEYCKQIEKAKKQGTLVKLSSEEVERLKGRPHHYTMGWSTSLTPSLPVSD